MSTTVCTICQKNKPSFDLIKGIMVRPSVAEAIKKDYPSWNNDSLICRKDLNHYRALHIEQILEKEKGELSTLDEQVVESIRKQEMLSLDPDKGQNIKDSLGNRLADKIAEFGGSWKFILSFGFVLFLWIFVNALMLTRPFDAFPFIFLNLILSCLAAIQAPVIMMSQNRQETKDRHRAEQDYRINLKAELEIRALHEKFDHILLQQWQHIMEIQQMQIEMMDEMAGKEE